MNINISDDTMMRHCYAACIQMMGFHDEGEDLINEKQTKREPVEIDVINIEGHEFAIVPQMMDPTDGSLVVMGLCMERIRAIEHVLNTPNAVLGRPSSELPEELTKSGFEIDGFQGSIMGDGSLLGGITEELYKNCKKASVRL